MSGQSSRRCFLKSAAVSSMAIGGASIAGWGSCLANVATVRHSTQDIVTGAGDYQYRVKHHYVQLPSEYSWQTTHNVAVDSQNRIYVIHEGREELKEHPSIFVFDDKGKFIRAFGSQY
ncbi:MAG: hypothetical protein ACKN82_03525, partial [Pirellula sp.]